MEATISRSQAKQTFPLRFLRPCRREPLMPSPFKRSRLIPTQTMHSCKRQWHRELATSTTSRSFARSLLSQLQVRWSVWSRPLATTSNCKNNAGDDLFVSRGCRLFTFPTPVTNGGIYNVSSVFLPPTSQPQPCNLFYYTGIASGNVTRRTRRLPTQRLGLDHVVRQLATNGPTITLR